MSNDNNTQKIAPCLSSLFFNSMTVENTQARCLPLERQCALFIAPSMMAIDQTGVLRLFAG